MKVLQCNLPYTRLNLPEGAIERVRQGVQWLAQPNHPDGIISQFGISCGLSDVNPLLGSVSVHAVGGNLAYVGFRAANVPDEERGYQITTTTERVVNSEGVETITSHVHKSATVWYERELTCRDIRLMLLMVKRAGYIPVTAWHGGDWLSMHILADCVGDGMGAANLYLNYRNGCQATDHPNRPITRVDGTAIEVGCHHKGSVFCDKWWSERRALTIVPEGWH